MLGWLVPGWCWAGVRLTAVELTLDRLALGWRWTYTEKIVPVIQFRRETALFSRKFVYIAFLFYIYKKIHCLHPTIGEILDITCYFSLYVQSSTDIEAKEQNLAMIILILGRRAEKDCICPDAISSNGKACAFFPSLQEI